MVDDQTTRPNWRRGIAFGVLALLLAVVVFLPLLDALFTGNADIVTGAALLLYYLVGAVIGYFSRIWWSSALLAWPCILFSLNNVAVAPFDPAVQRALPVAFVVLFVPLMPALGGGSLGKILAARRGGTAAGAEEALGLPQ
jgi:hypothetical protein